MLHRQFSIRDTLWLTIGGLTLLITLLSAHKTYESWQRLDQAQALQQLTIMNTRIFQSVDKLSEERGIAYIILHSPDENFSGSLTAALQKTRKEANDLVAKALVKIENDSEGDGRILSRQIQQQLEVVRGLRGEIDQAISQPSSAINRALAEKWFTASTILMEHLQDATLELYKNFFDSGKATTRHLRFNHLLSIINEFAGRERTFNGGLIVGKIAPTTEEQAKQWRWQGTIDLSWKIAGSLIDEGEIKSYFEEAKSHYYSSFDIMHNVIQPSETGEVTYLISETLWLQLASEALESLSALSKASLENTLRITGEIEEGARKEIILQFFLLIFALSLCGYSFYVIASRVLNPVHRMADALFAVMQGMPVNLDIAPAQRDDEIGKLASVLKDYQANSERIKHASAELARHVRALERSNKELDDFAYIASHDLKEPLRGLHNHSQFLLEDNEDKLDEESIGRLHRLIFLTQRMEKLINDLLYFSRLGRQEMAIQPTDLNEVIHDIEATLDHLLEERHGHIEIPTPLPTLTCDQTRITEAFRNLITNALKYNESAEKVIEIGFLKEYPTPDGAKAKNVIYVKDNGVGIAPEFRTEVFRIFRRLHSSKGAEDGTGVGLTFVKKIIERHGGAIWVESEQGKGSTFYFTLEGVVYETKSSK